MCLFTNFYCGVSVNILCHGSSKGVSDIKQNCILTELCFLYSHCWETQAILMSSILHVKGVLARSSLTQYCSSWVVPGFPHCFSAFQNLALRQVLLLTPVWRGSFQLKMAWGWFNIIQPWRNGQENLRWETSTNRKEHNQSSPKHHFCLSNPPNCVNKRRRGMTVCIPSLPPAYLLAWPGGKTAMYSLIALDCRSAVC